MLTAATVSRAPWEAYVTSATQARPIRDSFGQQVRTTPLDCSGSRPWGWARGRCIGAPGSTACHGSDPWFRPVTPAGTRRDRRPRRKQLGQVSPGAVALQHGTDAVDLLALGVHARAISCFGSRDDCLSTTQWVSVRPEGLGLRRQGLLPANHDGFPVSTRAQNPPIRGEWCPTAQV